MTKAGVRLAALQGTPEEVARAGKIRRRALRQCQRWLEKQGAWLDAFDWDPARPRVSCYLRQWANDAAALERLRQYSDAQFWIVAEGAEPWELLDCVLGVWRQLYILRA